MIIKMSLTDIKLKVHFITVFIIVSQFYFSDSTLSISYKCII